jgi:hypothetical protein
MLGCFAVDGVEALGNLWKQTIPKRLKASGRLARVFGPRAGLSFSRINGRADSGSVVEVSNVGYVPGGWQGFQDTVAYHLALATGSGLDNFCNSVNVFVVQSGQSSRKQIKLTQGLNVHLKSGRADLSWRGGEFRILLVFLIKKLINQGECDSLACQHSCNRSLNTSLKGIGIEDRKDQW